MLSNLLNTNEIKNSAGTEVEFGRRGNPTKNANAIEYYALTEGLVTKHTFLVSHQVVGKGKQEQIQSVVIFRKTVISTVDSQTPCTFVGQLKLTSPSGLMLTTAESANVLSELGSFCFLTGADSTFKYDGTGTGGAALLNRTL